MVVSEHANGAMSRRHNAHSTRVTMTADPWTLLVSWVLLQDISSRLVCLEDKVKHVVEQIEDLMDNYHSDNDIKYPDDLLSKSMKAEFEAS